MMKRSALIFISGICLAFFLGTSPRVFADDCSITFDIGLGDDPCNWAHDDESPFKGWADVTVTNTGTQPWGDFHFGFYDPIGGQDISNLAFLDVSLDAPADPCSSQSPLTWTINNTVVGATIDLKFYSDPVNPGGTATFGVYTDNPDHLDWFGLSMYPTPVPEPMTVVLLSLGGLALLKKRKR